MNDNNSPFKNVLYSLLSERLPKSEVQSLKDEGFRIKNPTRMSAVMVALYKKAVSGDLSSIKELNLILSGNESEGEMKAVTIIDDIKP
ncbi:MAG: hypothetical protein MJ080_00610 [Clostridia bacterium]|nr:hypothetical protein [Clostridia bacterium]